jgi:ABC-type amino acid transport substrate-binding protein
MKATVLPLLFSVCILLVSAQQPSIVLVRNFDVLVTCTIGATGKAGSQFSGFDIDYFTSVAQAAGLNPSSWNFQCVDTNTLWSLLASNPNLYLGAMGGLQISFDQMQAGYLYSQPTMITGLSVLIATTSSDWVFLQVFQVNFGLLLIATAFFVGTLLFFLEKRANALEVYLWHAFSSMFFCNSAKISTTPARMVMVSYWFMILIIISTYTANMTNIMSINQILNGISSAQGLNQKTIRTFDGYEFLLYPFGAKPVTTVFPTTLAAAELDFSEAMVDGYAIDDVIARSYAYQSCDMDIVARLFQPFSYAMAFSNAQNQTLMDTLNSAIQSKNQNISFTYEIDQYLQNNQSMIYCGKVNDNPGGQIDIPDIQGLWIILAGALAFSTLLHLVSKFPFYKRFRKFLDKWEITTPYDPAIEERKVGDDLIVENLRDVTYKLMRNLEGSINERLSEMDEKVTKFYELLLSGEKDNLNDSLDSDSAKEGKGKGDGHGKDDSNFSGVFAPENMDERGEKSQTNVEGDESEDPEGIEEYKAKAKPVAPLGKKAKKKKLTNEEIQEDDENNESCNFMQDPLEHEPIDDKSDYMVASANEGKKLKASPRNEKEIELENVRKRQT